MNTAPGLSDLFVGVDVGSRSVRASLFDADGQSVGVDAQVREIAVHHDESRPHVYEQCSEEILDKAVACVADLIQLAEGASPGSRMRVKGFAFAATCSTVVRSDMEVLRPSVTPPDHPAYGTAVSEAHETYSRDTIMWMDHRAIANASTINGTRHPALAQVGGTISPEMHVPKIMWLYDNHPDFDRDAELDQHRFYDLTDLMTMRASGDPTIRSLCCAVCKFNYQPPTQPEAQGDPWAQSSLYRHPQVNLGAIASGDVLGSRVLPPGDCASSGALPRAGQPSRVYGGRFREQLPRASVAVGAIDAHAGVIGCLGADCEDPCARLVLISGTSCCIMRLSRETVTVPGVWGPYRDAILPGYTVYEAGQSAAGSLLDHVVGTHPYFLGQPAWEKPADAFGELEEEWYADESRYRESTRHLHVNPDFHGNRSPLADPDLRGMVLGLTLNDADLSSLVRLYAATIQALAYGALQIVRRCRDTSDTAFPPLKDAVLTGGLARSRIYREALANVLQCPIATPVERQCVALGAAILGAAADAEREGEEGGSAHLWAKMRQMSRLNPSRTAPSRDAGVRKFHEQKYEVFLELQRCQERARAIMEPPRAAAPGASGSGTTADGEQTEGDGHGLARS